MKTDKVELKVSIDTSKIDLDKVIQIKEVKKIKLYLYQDEYGEIRARQLECFGSFKEIEVEL